MQARLEQARGLLARRRSLVYVLGLAVVLAAFYWPAVTLQGVFYVGDIARLNHPARVVYAAALRQWRLPLWTPDALAGYPILAEGQTGVYYPPNLILYRLLPVPAALNYSILLSYWVAGAGLFLYLRALNLRRGAAFLGGCILMLGGFLPAHLNHVNMIAAASWLPLLLWAEEHATRSGDWRAWAPVAGLFGLMGLAGHPQVMLLSAMLLGAYALAGPLGPRPGPFSVRRQLAQAALCCAALAAGGALALVQLAPSLELMRLSQRQQALSYEYFTSFSMLLSEMLTLLSPFLYGNPYPAKSVEVIGYMGLLPLALALLAPLRRQTRAVGFWAVIGMAGGVLALGAYTSVYKVMWRLPIVNRFRVPARYLLWVDLAIVVLAAVAVDSLLDLTRESAVRIRPRAAVALPILTLPALLLVQAPVDALLGYWRWLPVLWFGSGVALVAWLHWRPPGRLWLALLTAVVLADLGGFLGVLGGTYNDLESPSELGRTPSSVQFLGANGTGALARTYTDQSAYPGLPVMEESLYGNFQLLHGVQAVNAYFPLVPEPQQWLLDNLSPRLLNLMGVQYVLMPQQEPQDGPHDFFLAKDSTSPSLVDRQLQTQAWLTSTVELEGFTFDTGDLPAGTPVAEVVLHPATGPDAVWTLATGGPLGAWNEGAGEPATQQVIRTWPALFSGGSQGYTYLARHWLDKPLRVVSVEVRTLVPRDCLRIEAIRLIDPEGRAHSPAEQTGHTLAYCSPSAAIYRNPSAGERAFLVHRAQVVANEGEARAALTAAGFDPQHEVVVTGGEALAEDAPAGEHVAVEVYASEYVRVRAVVGARGYLVLADSDYPGWTALVDGRPAPILQADALVRAVLLEPGEHVVEFSFAPASWRLGLAVTAMAWPALAAVLLRWRRQ